jgi:hypothetical protein
MRPPIEVRNTLRAAPVGVCIYCGAARRLSEEHIIPLALGGRFVIPEASCPNCSEITSDFERRVLRGFMRDARVTGGFPTRRPQERPQTLPLQIERDGVFEEMQLPSAQHPALLILPLLYPAGVLTGRDLKTGTSCAGYETLYFGADPVSVGKKLGATSIRTSVDWDLTSFARLLAKIAYGFAVAEYGLLPKEQVPILPLILGVRDDASCWLGSAQFVLAVESMQPTHAVGVTWLPHPIDQGTSILVARVKLFAPSGATGYEIVVARQPTGIAA